MILTAWVKGKRRKGLDKGACSREFTRPSVYGDLGNVGLYHDRLHPRSASIRNKVNEWVEEQAIFSTTYGQVWEMTRKTRCFEENPDVKLLLVQCP